MCWAFFLVTRSKKKRLEPLLVRSKRKIETTIEPQQKKTIHHVQVSCAYLKRLGDGPDEPRGWGCERQANNRLTETIRVL